MQSEPYVPTPLEVQRLKNAQVPCWERLGRHEPSALALQRWKEPSPAPSPGLGTNHSSGGGGHSRSTVRCAHSRGFPSQTRPREYPSAHSLWLMSIATHTETPTQTAHTFAPTLSRARILPLQHTCTHTFHPRYARTPGFIQLYTLTSLYTTSGTLLKKTKNKTTRHSPVHCISRSRTHTNTCSPNASTSLPQTPFLIRGTPVLRITSAWVGHARTHALPSRAGGGGLGRSPLGNPGVATAPCSAFCRQPRCWRQGEEGSWNNKGKLGRAQGGAAPAGPRGEPCTAGSSEAAWRLAGRTGGGEEKWGERGGAAA